MNMNEALKEIDIIINKIIEMKDIQQRYQSYSMKCANLELANDEYGRAKEKEDRYYDLLIKTINEYIDYPKKKTLFIVRQKQSSVHIDNTFSSSFKIVKIPYIDKQEYYCVINCFNKNINVREWGFHQGWRIEKPYQCQKDNP